MKTLATIGAVVSVTPEDEIWISKPDKTEYIDDKTPFTVVIEGRLEDGHIFYGMYGRVKEGPERYRELVCSLMTRLDADDWRVKTESQANFKIGLSPAIRNHQFDFRHPEGTKIEGYPVIGRFGRVKVVQ
jgi:hypothetical protein